LILPLI